MKKQQVRGLWDYVPIALFWRYFAHSIMVLLAIIHERIPAPTLSDRVLTIIPYIPFIARYNYHIWILCYIPVALWFWRVDRNRFVEFLYTGGVLSLIRGICIGLTSLGPVNGRDINAGKPLSELIVGWLNIVNPVSALTSDAAHVYLTKDLFFSGHTASTFLLLLYTWKYKKIRPFAIAGHVIVVSTVFLSHLHYTIDVVGAWAIAFCVFVISQKIFLSINNKQQ